jgi:hypothetical protein
LSTPVGGDAEATMGVSPPNRFVRALLTLTSVDRLMLWGVLLVIVGAFASGAFGLSLNINLGK